MLKNCLFLFVLGFSNCAMAASLNDVLPDPYPQVYENVELLPFNAHGWYPHGPIFEKLVKENAVTNILEVGSWLGCSARHFATLIPNEGKVYAVDHWKGSHEHFVENETRALVPTLFRQFLSNVIHAKLTDKIIPVRMDSLTAANELKKLNLTIDLIYIDGAHDYKAVYKDLKAWYPFVKDKGVFCGDDWNVGDVQQAVKRFAQKNNLQIYHEGGFWRLHK